MGGGWGGGGRRDEGEGYEGGGRWINEAKSYGRGIDAVGVGGGGRIHLFCVNIVIFFN